MACAKGAWIGAMERANSTRSDFQVDRSSPSQGILTASYYIG